MKLSPAPDPDLRPAVLRIRRKNNMRPSKNLLQNKLQALSNHKKLVPV